MNLHFLKLCSEVRPRAESPVQLLQQLDKQRGNSTNLKQDPRVRIQPRYPNLQRRDTSRSTTSMQRSDSSSLRAASLPLVFRVRGLDTVVPSQHYGALLPFGCLTRSSCHGRGSANARRQQRSRSRKRSGGNHKLNRESTQCYECRYDELCNDKSRY